MIPATLSPGDNGEERVANRSRSTKDTNDRGDVSRSASASASQPIRTLSRSTGSQPIPTLSREDLPIMGGASASQPIPTLSRADLSAVSAELPIAGPDPFALDPTTAGLSAASLPSVAPVGPQTFPPVGGPSPLPDPFSSNLSAASQSVAPVSGPDPFFPEAPELAATTDLPDDFSLTAGRMAPVAPAPKAPAPPRSEAPSFTLHDADKVEVVAEKSPPQSVTTYGTPKIRNKAAEAARKRRATIGAIVRLAAVIALVEFAAFTFGPDLPEPLGGIFAAIRAFSGG